MAGEAVLGVDVGGTAIKSTLLLEDGSTRAQPSVPTPRADPSGEAVAAVVADLVAATGNVAAVGLAVPGIVDGAAGVCRMSVNLGWRDVPIRDLVAARTGLPVLLAHDVRAGARGEWAAGATEGRAGGLLFAPLGTGLAVALLDAAGEPAPEPWAGEVGQLVWTTGPHAGARVEEVVSAGGLARRFGAPDARTVLAAVEAGDALAARLWEETSDALAELLAWAVAFSAPGTIVLGGGLAQAGEALFAPVRRSLTARLPGFPPPAVVPAVRGIDAAAFGVADLARSRLVDPSTARNAQSDFAFPAGDGGAAAAPARWSGAASTVRPNDPNGAAR